MFHDWTEKTDKLNSALKSNNQSFLEGEIKTGFVQFLNNAPLGKNKRILDLAPFSVNKFNSFRKLGFTNIHFAEFFNTLSKNKTVSLSEDSFELTDSDLFKLFFSSKVKESIKKFDVILCWDILNYLSKQNLKKTTNFLFKYSINSANLFALIHIKKTIPKYPISFELNDSGEFYSNTTDLDLVKATKTITTKKLQAVFTPWYLNKISLLQGSIHDVHFTK